MKVDHLRCLMDTKEQNPIDFAPQVDLFPLSPSPRTDKLWQRHIYSSPHQYLIFTTFQHVHSCGSSCICRAGFRGYLLQGLFHRVRQHRLVGQRELQRQHRSLRLLHIRSSSSLRHCKLAIDIYLSAGLLCSRLSKRLRCWSGCRRWPRMRHMLQAHHRDGQFW